MDSHLIIYHFHRKDAVASLGRLGHVDGFEETARKLALELNEVKLEKATALDEARGLKRKLSKCGTATALERERIKVKKLRVQKKNEHEKWR